MPHIKVLIKRYISTFISYFHAFCYTFSFCINSILLILCNKPSRYTQAFNSLLNDASSYSSFLNATVYVSVLNNMSLLNKFIVYFINFLKYTSIVVLNVLNCTKNFFMKLYCFIIIICIINIVTVFLLTTKDEDYCDEYNL